MKKYFNLIIILSVFLFLCCEKKTENSLEVDSDIVGWWLLQSKTIDNVEQDLNRCELESSLILDADERVINEIGYFDPQFGCAFEGGGSGTYVISGNEVTFNYDEGNAFNDSVTYTFELNDDKLFLDISNNEIYIYNRK